MSEKKKFKKYEEKLSKYHYKLIDIIASPDTDRGSRTIAIDRLIRSTGRGKRFGLLKGEDPKGYKIPAPEFFFKEYKAPEPQQQPIPHWYDEFKKERERRWAEKDSQKIEIIDNLDEEMDKIFGKER